MNMSIRDLDNSSCFGENCLVSKQKTKLLLPPYASGVEVMYVMDDAHQCK